MGKPKIQNHRHSCGLHKNKIITKRIGKPILFLSNSPGRKNFKKYLKKTLDKIHNLCYNIIVPRERNKKEKRGNKYD